MSTAENAEQVDTLVTQEMLDTKGIWAGERRSFPVDASDIRRWAIAVYWPDTPPKIFWDEEYARTTRWGDVIAPQDFNPFAWPVERPGRASSGPMPGEAPKKGDNILNGGQKDTYFVPIRPGDVITARSRLSHWAERRGRHGLTLYQYTETEWHNQNGELNKRRISTHVRY